MNSNGCHRTPQLTRKDHRDKKQRERERVRESERERESLQTARRVGENSEKTLQIHAKALKQFSAKDRLPQMPKTLSRCNVAPFVRLSLLSTVECQVGPGVRAAPRVPPSHMLLEFSSPGSETELLAATRQAFCIEHHTLVHKKWNGTCKLDKLHSML